MIQIRQNMFETNSSSCHVLIIPNDVVERLPKVIDLSSDDSNGDYTRRFVRELNEEDSKIFINWLYCNGVEEIKYYGSNKYINEFIIKYKDNYTDLGFPHHLYSRNGTTSGALINFLMGHYNEYMGRDEYMDIEDNESTFDIY